MKFETLWKNFPDQEKLKKYCYNKQPTSSNPFSDYCAISLSECLIKSGIDISLLKAKRCWSHSDKKHILLAEEFANALVERSLPGLSIRQKIVPGNFQTTLKGKNGIIFFKDYWQRGNESFQNRSGDHIDLWNKNELTGGGMFTRSIYEFFGVVSDLNKSKEVWFWEIK